MTSTDFIKKLIKDYFTIFALIVICMTISRQIFLPNKPIELKEIYIYMICSLLVDLPSLILYSSEEVSEKEMRIRRIIHLIALNAILLIFANVIGFLNDILDIVVLEFQIAVIYVLGCFLSWTNDKKATNRINEKLNNLREELMDEQKDE